jgi:hypothetical protein
MSFSLRNVRNACITKRDGGWELLTLPILSEKRKERGTRNSKLKPERRLKRGHPPGVKTMNKPKRTQIYFAPFLARAEDSSGGGYFGEDASGFLAGILASIPEYLMLTIGLPRWAAAECRGSREQTGRFLYFDRDGFL